jgi:hypothetical protein
MFGILHITTMNVIFGHSGTLPFAFCLGALPNLLPVARCLTFPSSSPPEAHLLNCLKPSPPTFAQSIQHYQNFPTPTGSSKYPKLCNRRLPGEGFISQLFQMVLSRDTGLMHLLEKLSHPYILPLVEHPNVGLPHSIGKLIQGDFWLLQADWGFTFSPAQVKQMITLIICIEFVRGNLSLPSEIGNPRCYICFGQCCSWPKLFGWEANVTSPRFAGNFSIWSRGGTCQPIDWNLSIRCLRHARCASR